MLFVLDWDGTVMDSTAKIVNCMQVSAVELDLPVLTDSEVKNIIGLGLPQAIRQLYPGISDSLLESFRQCYSGHFVRADQQPCAFFPGVMETLRTLREEGHLLAIATGKSRKGLDRVLSNLGLVDFFDSSRCADETASKPDPKMLSEILLELDFEAQEAVMVGDTEYDMEMAVNAGIRRIAVGYGAHDISRLHVYQPSLCVEHFSQILTWARANQQVLV